MGYLLLLVFVVVVIAAVVKGMNAGNWQHSGPTNQSPTAESESNPTKEWAGYIPTASKPPRNENVHEERTIDLVFPKSESTVGYYLFLDTETTGLPKTREVTAESIKTFPRIVSIAWLLFDRDGNEVRRSYHIIKQTRKIPARAIAIHGITDEIAEAEGKDAKDVFAELSADISNSKAVITHNLGFDLPIIQANMMRTGFEKPLVRHKRCCTMLATTAYVGIPSYNGGGGFKYPSLSELYQHCFFPGSTVTILDQHNALIDVAIVAKCFFHLKEADFIVEGSRGKMSAAY